MAPTENLAPAYLAIFCTLTGIATALVALRLWARAKIVKNVGTDDWVVLLSLILVLGSLGCLVASCSYGLGRHTEDLSRGDSIEALKFLWIAFNITPAAEISAKISITLMLMRITTSRTWYWIFVFLIVSNIAVTIASNFTFLFSCRPLQKLWDSEIEGFCDTNGRNIELYVQGVTAAAYDVILAFAPVILLWNVQIKIRDKVLLCGLFALGCFTATAGIIRITFTDATSFSKDPTWDAMPFVLWKCVELPLSIVVGCLPTLRPLFASQKVPKFTSVHLRDGYTRSTQDQFHIRKTTEIYIQSTEAESATHIIGKQDWTSMNVLGTSPDTPDRRYAV